MSKRFTLFIALFSLLFIVLFIILSYHSRLATDDYYFIGDIKNHGTFEQVYFQYLNWSGRFTSYLAINIVYNLFKLNQWLYNFLPPISLFLFITGTYSLLKNTLIHFSISLETKIIFLFSVCMSSLVFFLSYDIGETWFWYCSYSSYLWSLIALIWGTSFIIKKKSNFFINLGIILCFVYVGGSSELYNSIIGLCYAIILWYLYKKKNLTLSSPQSKKIILGFIAFSIAFLILIIAPGNYLRDGLFPEHDFVKALLITAKSCIKFLFIYLPTKLIYILSFAPLAIIIGIHLRTKISVDLKPFNKIFIKIL